MTFRVVHRISSLARMPKFNWLNLLDEIFPDSHDGLDRGFPICVSSDCADFMGRRAD